MGYDVAVFGELALPATASAAWKKLPSTRDDWPDAFGVAVTSRGTIGKVITMLAKPPGDAWGWRFAATPTSVAIRGVMPDDCYLDHARLIAQLWLGADEVGGTGTLMFRGFETADTGWIVKSGRIEPMTTAEKQAADAAPEMAELHEAAAKLVSGFVNPFTKKRR
jgi:hypothetical protein